MSKVFNMVGGGGGPAASIFVTGLPETDTVTATNGVKTLTGKLEYIVKTIDTSIPAMTSNTAPSGRCFCGGGCNWPTSNIYNVFGQIGFISNTEWNITTPSPAWIGYDFGSPVIIKKWTSMMQLGSGASYVEDATVVLQGSNDDTNYYDIGDTVPVSDFSSQKEVSVDNKTEYRYYRLYFNKTPMKRNSYYDINNMQYLQMEGITNQIASGHMLSPIRDFGTWTVTATDGTKTATQDVLVDVITEYEIEMNYKLWLYRDGDECEDVTGGWTNSGYTYNGSANQAVTKYSDSMYATTHIGDSLTAGIVNPVDVTNYSTLFAEVMRTDSSNLFQPWIGIASDKSLSDKLVTPSVSSANVKETLSIDITSLTGNKYVAFVHSNANDSGSGYVYKVWLEQ